MRVKNRMDSGWNEMSVECGRAVDGEWMESDGEWVESGAGWNVDVRMATG